MYVVEWDIPRSFIDTPLILSPLKSIGPKQVQVMHIVLLDLTCNKYNAFEL